MPAYLEGARIDAASDRHAPRLMFRGDLATAAGNHATAADALETAWRRAQDLRVPLALAQLEICDGRRLRAAGQLRAAIARLRAARQRLIPLGARPYLQACDRELTAADAPAGAAPAPALPGLTSAEQAVARLVATGRSNRQTATELYISVKTVEFHLCAGWGLCYPVNGKIFASASEIIATAKTACMTGCRPEKESSVSAR
jgi:ATP/maltotriose-dependent transcriptional regulator MalT